jgi:hypothetical protein
LFYCTYCERRTTAATYSDRCDNVRFRRREREGSGSGETGEEQTALIEI